MNSIDNTKGEKQRNGNVDTGGIFAQSKELGKCSQKECKEASTDGHSNTDKRANNKKESTRKKQPATTKSKEVPTQAETIKRLVAIHALPTNYYIGDNHCPLPTKPWIVRSSEGVRVSYKKITDNEKEKAEILAQKGLNAKKHPRIAGWTPDDMVCLLPNQSGNGSWLSNFVINHMLLLLEEHAREIGNKVRTLNCDVLNHMTKLCKKLFVQNKYHTLYPNVLDCDVLLSLFNQSQHWMLLSVFPREKSMVFLDSLYRGSEGETAFLRCCNFLTCATEDKIDWSEWQFLIIPEEHTPQQLNFNDCGMFSIKSAEHIAFGIPLDFQQGNIEDFRYSTILSLFAQKVEVDYQYCELPEAAKLKGHTQHTTARIDQNVTLEINEEKVCKTQTHDTDDTMMYPHTWNG